MVIKFTNKTDSGLDLTLDTELEADELIQVVNN